MRLSLFAGLAALAAAVDFDDDDINFLRMLQSNGSNASATTVMSGNTTVMSANTTVAPVATTVASMGNTTVASATTVASNMSATTVASMATTVASMATTVASQMSATTVPPPAPSNLCVKETYTANMFPTPTAAEITQQSHVIGITGCTPKDTVTADNYYSTWGAASQTTANKDKCGAGAKDLTCAASNSDLNTWFAGLGSYKKGAVLGRCCGKYPSNMAALAADDSYLAGTLKTDPTVTMGIYSDNACATAATAAQLLAYDYQTSQLFATNPMVSSGCVTPSGNHADSGMSRKYLACNQTSTAGAMDKAIVENYFDSGCAATYEVETTSLSNCQSMGSGNSTLYGKGSCSGGTTVNELVISNTVSLAFDASSLPATVATAVQSSILGVTCNSLKDQQDTASGDAAAVTTTVDSCSGTGKLADGVYTARRRARRLASHDATKVNAVIKSVVPATSASTIKTAMTTAMTDGSGNAKNSVLDAVVTAITTAAATDTALSSAVGNLTAANLSGTSAVSEPTIPITVGGGGGGGGSTSGAMAQFLGMGASLLLGAALMI